MSYGKRAAEDPTVCWRARFSVCDVHVAGFDLLALTMALHASGCVRCAACVGADCHLAATSIGLGAPAASTPIFRPDRNLPQANCRDMLLVTPSRVEKRRKSQHLYASLARHPTDEGDSDVGIRQDVRWSISGKLRPASGAARARVDSVRCQRPTCCAPGQHWRPPARCCHVRSAKKSLARELRFFMAHWRRRRRIAAPARAQAIVADRRHARLRRRRDRRSLDDDLPTVACTGGLVPSSGAALPFVPTVWGRESKRYAILAMASPSVSILSW